MTINEIVEREVSRVFSPSAFAEPSVRVVALAVAKAVVEICARIARGHADEEACSDACLFVGEKELCSEQIEKEIRALVKE